MRSKTIVGSSIVANVCGPGLAEGTCDVENDEICISSNVEIFVSVKGRHERRGAAASAIVCLKARQSRHGKTGLYQ